MNLNLYQNVVDQSKDLEIRWIYLFHIGESNLHPELNKMIKYAKEKRIKIRLHTNGTQDMRDFDIDDLHISLNETEFSRIEKQITKLVSEGIGFKIDSIEGISKPIPEAYRKYLRKKTYYNWQGKLTINRTNSFNILCSHPYKSMVVLWNGSCVACCVDYDNRWIIGDARSESLEEIWNGKKMQKLRKYPVSMCKKCNLPRIPEKERIDYERQN